MDELTTIEYAGVLIRVYGMKHNPYFSGPDVAQALGYANAVDAIRRYVDAEDKTASMLISEYGLYSMIANSENLQAKRVFTGEVLPQIHRRGMYRPKKEEKKYVRRYEISTGERLTKDELRNMARSFGMTKTETRQGSVAALSNYIEERLRKKAEADAYEAAKIAYPYSYDEIDEASEHNLPSLMHILPKDSYVCVNGSSRFNDAAMLAIKEELARWR